MKEKSKLERTPQKNDQGKRKISPTKKESESKKSKLAPLKSSPVRAVKKEASMCPRGLDVEEPRGSRGGNTEECLLWVDKYKPTSLKNIIGQQGDQSCANKLLRWLGNWHKSSPEEKKHGDFTTLVVLCVSVSMQCSVVCLGHLPVSKSLLRLVQSSSALGPGGASVNKAGPSGAPREWGIMNQLLKYMCQVLL